MTLSRQTTGEEPWRRAVLRHAKITVLGLLLAVSGLQPSDLHGQANGLSEYDVKAAFLLNFAKFVQWPPEAFQNEQSPLLLCIAGEDPFGPALNEIVRGKAISSHPFLVRRTNNLDDLKACQIVYIGGSDNKRLAEILRHLKGSSALAIGESRDFTGLGGGIQFYLENNKVRFSINVDAVQRAHLTVSSKLLALAKIVHDEGGQNGE